MQSISKQQNGQNTIEQHEAEQQNAGCTENEAEHRKRCLESVTGNAQPGACVDVLPPCSLCGAVQPSPLSQQ